MSLKQFNRKFEPAEPLPIVAVVGAAALGYCLYKSCSTPAIQKERERQIQQLIRESDNVRWANMIVNKENLVEQSVTYFADRLSQKMISAHAVERLFDDTDVLQYVILKLRINWIDLCLDVGFQEKYPQCLDNYDVALLSCETNSSMYKHLSGYLRKDDKIIHAALNCYGYREGGGYYSAGHNFDILKDIPQYLNAEYALFAVKMNGSALKHVVNKTNQITMEALMENGYQAFQYATEEQKNTPLIRATAFGNSNSLLSSPDFLKYCLPAEIENYTRDKERADRQLEDSVMNGY